MTDHQDTFDWDSFDWEIRREAEALAREFAGIFSRETIGRFMHESQDALGGSRIAEYVPLLARRFTRERLVALAQVEGTMIKQVPEVLFVCVQNAGRSQIAAVLTDHIGRGRVHVRSAGSTPANEINPTVIEAMREAGLDLDQEFPKPLTDEVVRAADVVITMGCGDACPIYPGKRYMDWEVGDPADQPVEVVRQIRDDIRGRVQGLLQEMGILEGDAPAPRPQVTSATKWAEDMLNNPASTQREGR